MTFLFYFKDINFSLIKRYFQIDPFPFLIVSILFTIIKPLYSSVPDFSLRSPADIIRQKYDHFLTPYSSTTQRSLDILHAYNDQSSFKDYTPSLTTLHQIITQKSPEEKSSEINAFFRLITATIYLKRAQEERALQKIIQEKLHSIYSTPKEELREDIEDLVTRIKAQEQGIQKIERTIGTLHTQAQHLRSLNQTLLEKYVTLPFRQPDSVIRDNKINEGKCPICLESIAQSLSSSTELSLYAQASVISACNHIFCSNCAEMWNKTHEEQVILRNAHRFENESPEPFTPTCSLCRQPQEALYTFTLQYAPSTIASQTMFHTATQTCETTDKSIQTESCDLSYWNDDPYADEEESFV